jgi:hypothetical protein
MEQKILFKKSPSQSSLAQVSQARLPPMSPHSGYGMQKDVPMAGSPARALRSRSSSTGGYRVPQANRRLPERPAMVSETSWAMMKNLDRMFAQTFKAFCGSQHETLDFVGFARLCKHCFLIDRRLSEDDAGTIFQRVLPSGELRLTFSQFEVALELLAKQRGLSMKVLRSDVALCGGPSLQSRTHNGAGSRRSGLVADLKGMPHKAPTGADPVHASESTENAENELKIKARDALFEALFGEESDASPPPSAPCAPSPDPNFAIKVKAQTALLEALCISDEEEEITADVSAIKQKAQDALARALEMENWVCEDSGVDNQELEDLRSKARGALQKALEHHDEHDQAEDNMLE